MPDRLTRFVIESNAIEGIHRDPYAREMAAHRYLLSSERITVALLEEFVEAVQPGAKLRRRKGMNVRVGGHIAPLGGQQIERRLTTLLATTHGPYSRHVLYEHLHPFMDGNGRSGRVLWLHDMGGIEAVPLSFLHTFYYQTLANSDGP